MANTKLSTMLATTAALALAACGGGSSAVNNNPTLPPSASPVTTTLKSYSNGAGVISASETDKKGFSASSNAALFLTVIENSSDLNVVSGTEIEVGNLYGFTLTGIGSDGSIINVFRGGEYLNATEFVQASFVVIGNEIGLTSGGSPLKGLPSGSFTYNGIANVVGVEGLGDGTFTMSANFTNNSGSIAATIPANNPVGLNNPAYFFSSNNLTINQANGNFTSSDALIGKTGVASEAASISGNFAGTNAKGVYGIVYTNSLDVPEYFGSFYGSR